MFEAATCSETVTIIEAILLGADGACVDIGVTSLLGGVALFIGAVIGLRFVGISLLRRVFPSLRRASKPSDEISVPQLEEGLKRLPYESPIKSTGAWGTKTR